MEELRNSAAANIKSARASERSPKTRYITHRGIQEYENSLSGLSGFLGHVKTLSSNKILDIGIGEGRAFKTMVMHLEPEIEMIGTNLSRTLFSGSEKVRLTSGEVLRGFEKNSIGGVISVYGLAYSNPKLSVPRLKEILVPGGTVKIKLFKYGGVNQHGIIQGYSTKEYISEFKESGFTVMDLGDGVIIAILQGDQSQLKKIAEQDQSKIYSIL